MFLRTSPAAIAVFNSQSPILVPAFSASSGNRPSRRCPVRHVDSQHGVGRRYATTFSSSRSSSSHRQNHNEAPPPWPSSPQATPYDVFAIPRQEPYTKKRFYQLVKLYHPDIHGIHHVAPAPTKHAVPPSVRLERYRLVIAANDILSSPHKRHLYDTYGLGWTPPGGHTTPNAELRAADRSWRDQPGSAAMNATWEDWERWHAARAGRTAERQGVLYMPNTIFALVIAVMCTIGAVAQGRRAESAGQHFVEVTTQQHQNVSENVRQSTTASAGLSQDERVERFLRDRENVTFQFAPAKYERNARPESPTIKPPD